MPVSNSSIFKDWLQDWLIQDWLATNMELPEKKTKLDKQPERKRQKERTSDQKEPKEERWL